MTRQKLASYCFTLTASRVKKILSEGRYCKECQRESKQHIIDHIDNKTYSGNLLIIACNKNNVWLPPSNQYFDYNKIQEIKRAFHQFLYNKIYGIDPQYDYCGQCPICFGAVYIGDENGKDGPTTLCACDLPEKHPFYCYSPVTEAMQEVSGNYSKCPLQHKLIYGDPEHKHKHYPMHFDCYMSQ